VHGGEEFLFVGQRRRGLAALALGRGRRDIQEKRECQQGEEYFSGFHLLLLKPFSDNHFLL
jgi:hypothetical protein